jgi:hypothetical protein
MRKYLYIGIAVFILWAGYTQWRLIVVREKLKETEAEREQALEIANGLKLDTIRYRGKLKFEVLRSKALILSNNNLEKMLSGRFKEVSNAKVKPKKIESVTFTNTVVEPFKIPPTDTVYLYTCEAFHYQYRDEFNAIDVLAIDTPRMRIEVPVYGIPHKLRRKFLGLRIGKMDVWFDAWTPNKLVNMDSAVFIDVKN